MSVVLSASPEAIRRHLSDAGGVRIQCQIGVRVRYPRHDPQWTFAFYDHPLYFWEGIAKRRLFQDYEDRLVRVIFPRPSIMAVVVKSTLAHGEATMEIRNFIEAGLV